MLSRALQRPEEARREARRPQLMVFFCCSLPHHLHSECPAVVETILSRSGPFPRRSGSEKLRWDQLGPPTTDPGPRTSFLPLPLSRSKSPPPAPHLVPSFSFFFFLISHLPPLPKTSLSHSQLEAGQERGLCFTHCCPASDP